MPEVVNTPEQPGTPINIDALSAPEGTSAENFEMFKPGEEKVTYPVPSFGGLPNLDPKSEDKIEQPVVTPEGKVEPPIVDPNKKPEEKHTDTSDWYIKPFKALQKKLELSDEEFKIPEGVTEENYLDKYNELLWEHTEQEEDLHPDVKQINQLIKNGVDPKEAISTFQKMNDIISLSDKDLVSLSLKQQFGKSEQKPDGKDEAWINERITKMDNSGLLEIEGQRIRDAITQDKQNITARNEAARKEANAKQQAEVSKVRSELVNKSIEYLKGMKDVFGMPISKAEVTEFQDDFRYLVEPVVKDGRMTTQLNELLQSDENLVKVAYILSKGDSKIKEALTKAKEGAKKSAIEKLDDKPQLPKKSSSYLNEGAIDLDKLEAPAR